MSESLNFHEKVYRAYLEFFETSERKRRWNMFDDLPWEKLDRAQTDERKALRLETFCAEELYAPDYGFHGLALTRPHFGIVWFQMCWTQEEARHGLALREYLTRSGLRSPAQFAWLEQDLFAREWELPFATTRQMACYGALQEAATYLAYKAQKEFAREQGDAVLEAMFSYISRDEAAHAGFYRSLIQFEMEDDRAGTLADLANVIAGFKMPGDGLIPNYQERLRISGAGISTRTFLEHALFPLLKTLKTSRAELRAATQASAPSMIEPAPAIA